MKENQQNKINYYLEDIPIVCQTGHATIQEILEDNNIPSSSKSKAIFWSIMNERIGLDDTERFLRNYSNKKTTEFKRMLSAYDFKKYSI